MQSTLVSWGCLPKFNIFIFNLFRVVMGHFDWPFKKNSNTSNAPPNGSFYYHWCSFSTCICNTSPHFWAKDMKQIVLLLRNLLDACSWVHVAPPHSLSWISILNFVHQHFWFAILQELGYLWWFILISLINCNASLFICLLVAMDHFDWPIIKKIMKLWECSIHWHPCCHLFAWIFFQNF